MNNACLQDKSASGEDSDSIDWNTDDELEIQGDTTFSSSSTLTTRGTEAFAGYGEVRAMACMDAIKCFAMYRLLDQSLSLGQNFC